MSVRRLATPAPWLVADVEKAVEMRPWESGRSIETSGFAVVRMGTDGPKIIERPTKRGVACETARQRAREAPGTTIGVYRVHRDESEEVAYEPIGAWNAAPDGLATLRGEVATDRIRRETFGGEEHVVLPVVAMVEGVHHASNSPVPTLWLAEEFLAPPEAWNGRPVTFRHPEIDGIKVSANDRAIADRVEIGRVFHARGENGKLLADLFINLRKAEEAEARATIEAVERGERTEVSVGAWTQRAEAHGTFGGEPYEAIERGVKPDHIAILGPDEMGACSWEDGCGTPRAALQAAVRSEARRPTFDGTETTEWTAPSLADYVEALFEGDDPPTSVDALSSDLKRRIASHTLLGEAEADDFRNLSFFPVVRPSTGRLNRNALQAVLGGRGSQADIPQAARDSAQAMARRLLESEFGDEPESQTQRRKEMSVERKKRLRACGENLARLLNERLDELADGDDDRRGELIQEMADNSGEARGVGTISVSTVNQILRGEIDCPPVPRLEGFARVLDLTQERIFGAAEADGCAVADASQNVEALIAHPLLELEDADRMWLSKIPTERRAALLPNCRCKSQAVRPDKEVLMSRNDLEAAAERLGLRVYDATVQTLSADDRRILDEAKAERQARHAALVQKVEAAEGSPWSREELEAMEIAQLQKLVAAMKLDEPPADFAANAVPPDEEAVPATLSLRDQIRNRREARA